MEETMVKICVIGSGYVGLTTSAVLAELGHEVYSVDVDKQKIDRLKEGEVPIYEPELEQYIQQNVKAGRLFFSTEIEACIMKSEIILIAVGTPPLADGSSDLSYIENVVNTIADGLISHKIIVTKSTVPPGTNEWIQETLLNKGVNPHLFDVVSNPEFLKEGSAIHDLLYPDKIVIGAKSVTAAEAIKKMYKGLPGKCIVTSLTGAELIKYASNTFLATKISFINEMARICDAYDVNVEDVAFGIGTDPRIGPLFLKAGLGYGGSCFPKDISSLHHAAQEREVDVPLLEATMHVNNTQVDIYLDKFIQSIAEEREKQDVKVAIWGLTFKPNTDDTRLSPAIAIIHKLKERGITTIHAHDPLVTFIEQDIVHHTDLYEAVEGTHALIVATDWDVYKSVDWERIGELMEGNVVLDGRNMYHPSSLTKKGFQYVGLGRPID